jgi:FKBP-type peptidyl-prolyl cis-trans isomerase
MNRPVTLGIILILVVGIVSFLILKQQKSSDLNETANQGTISQVTPTPAVQQSASGSAAMNTDQLKIEDTQVGTGKEAKSGDTVVMNYRGTLLNGTEFDSSFKRNQPFTTQIGVGQVIKGWDEGVPGMKVGGKRKLTIPADMAYGARGVPGVIPPNSTLVFEVELLDLK